MAGEGVRDSTTDDNIDLTDACNNLWSLRTDKGGNVHTPVTISYEHHKVHEGKLFGAGYYSSSVANNGAINVLLQTPVGTTAHVYLKVNVGGDAVFRAFEGTTVSAAGTAITPIDHNRETANTATITVTHTPTITDDGTQLWEEFIPGGTSSGGGGGGGGSHPGAVATTLSEQIILKADETYLLRLTNISGGAQPEDITFSFYEVPAST